MSAENASSVERIGTGMGPGYPFRTAFGASWRLTLTVGSVAVLPLGALSFLLVRVGLPPAEVLPVLVVGVLFALSIFTHELGHAMAYWLLARSLGHRPEMASRGSFREGAVIHWTLGHSADAVVALAGPCLGFVTLFPCLLPQDGFLLSFPLLVLFFIHPACLRRRHSDGAQLFAHLRRKETACS